jgi:hypothetical protein
MLYRVQLTWAGFELTTLVVIGTDCVGSITTTTVLYINLENKHIIKDSSNGYNKNIILNQIKSWNGNNKIYLYKFLKQNENEMEYYLSHPDRHILTKFRLSEHKLLIEIGRNLKIPRDQRLCAICNVLEDEFHFFFKCKRNANNRNILYQCFQNIYSNFLELNHEEKLTKILNLSTPEHFCLWRHSEVWKYHRSIDKWKGYTLPKRNEVTKKVRKGYEEDTK